ncbi:hypothetical protein [Fructobacillus tropaeoli]|uniref:hypothetical protein n=1 Tax=Fructobacillus tropaeoli TaxID=709323 RepID=UPI002DA6D09A|nr:unnamed protein product [Fructobacillus tropaeoli]
MSKVNEQNLKLDTPEDIAQAMINDPVYYGKIQRRYWRLLDEGQHLDPGYAHWVFAYLFQAYFKHLGLKEPLYTATPVSEILLAHMLQVDAERRQR